MITTIKRTRTVSGKFTPAEYEALLGHARNAGVPLGIFCRETMLANVLPSDSIAMVAAEIRCIRSIFLELATRALNRELISNEWIVEIINDAEAQKYARADQSIEQLRRAKNGTAGTSDGRAHPGHFGSS